MTTRKPKTQATEESKEESNEPAFEYATEYFKAANIPYCKTCGDQFRTDLDGNPFCPIQKEGCDRNQSES